MSSLSLHAGPTVTVMVTPNGAPVLGNDYGLTGDVTGDGNLSPSRTYQWTRDNGTGPPTQVGTNSSSLSFSPLSLSDAGRYSCSVTVSSPYLNSDIMTSSGFSQPLMFQGELTCQ